MLVFEGVKRAMTVLGSFEESVAHTQITTHLSGGALDDFQNQIIKLSSTIPVGTQTLLSISKVAGELGVHGSKDLLAFTDTVARLGAVTNFSGEQAATTMAQILTVTGESTDTVGKLADELVKLSTSNAIAGGTSALANLTHQIAEIGSTYKIGSGSAAALAASLGGLGGQAESAGIAVSKILHAISDASRNSGSGEASIIASIVGSDPDQLKKAFGDDALGVFQRFVGGLGAIRNSGGDVMGVLKQLGLEDERMLKSILPLINNSELLKKNLDLVAHSSGALAGETQVLFNTMEGRWETFKNIVNAAVLQFRNSTGGISTALGVVNDALKIIIGLETPTQQTSKAVTGVVEAFKALAAVSAVYVGLNMADLFVKMAAGAFTLAGSIGSATVMSNKLLTSVSAVGVFLAGWSIGSTLFDQFETVRKFGIETIDLLARTQAFWGNGKLVAQETATLNKRIAEMGKDRGTQYFALEQITANHMQSNPNGVPWQLSKYGKAGTVPFSKEDQAIYDQRLGGLLLGEIDPTYDLLDMLKSKTIKYAKDEAPKEPFGQSFMRNAADSVKQVTDALGILTNNKDILDAMDKLGKLTDHPASGAGANKSQLDSVSALIQKNTILMNQQNQFIGLNATQSAELKAYYELLDAGGTAEIAKNRQLVEQYMNLIDQQAKLKANAEIDIALRGLKEESDLLRLNNDAREVAIQQNSILLKYQHDGVTLDQQTIDKVHQQVVAFTELQKQMGKIDDIGKGIGDAFSNFFTDAITGAKDLKSAFLDLGKAIERVVVQELISKPIGSGISNFIQTLGKAAAGGSAGTSTVVAHALGDVVDSPTFFSFSGSKRGVMGEAGPEAIMPLERGSDGRLGVRGGGGGNVYMTINTPNADSFRKSTPQIQRAMRKAMR